MRTTALGMMCALVMTGAGCAELDESGDRRTSESTVCTTVGTTQWSHQGFAEQRDRFRVELAATPSGPNIDAVVGVSRGAASQWTALAAIVRFNPDGFIDARAGSSYTAVQSLAYEAGITYFVRLDVDVRTHTYSAWVSLEQGNYGSWNQVARDYAFRSEQASVVALDTVSSFVNPQTGPGTLQLCGVVVNRDTGSTCIGGDAGGGFANYAVAPGLDSMIVDVEGRPSTDNMDGVIGVALGDVDAYNDLAVSVRFWTDGTIEARDGDTYRALTPVGYRAGQTYSFRFVVDISNKIYSVFVRDPSSGRGYELARDFRFRPQQALVSRLDRVAVVVASPSGHVDACTPRSSAHPSLVYAFRGAYTLTPLSNDGALLSGVGTTKRLDATGRIAATLPVGGATAADSSDNLYVASTNGSAIFVGSYTSTGALRWSRTIASDGFPNRAAVTTTGRLLITTGPSNAARVYFVTTDGSASGLVHSGLPGAVTPGPTGYVISAPLSDGVQFSSYDPNGSVRWSRVFQGSFDVSSLALGPDGSVVFGGEFFGDINFGDKTLFAGGGEDGPRNAYLVSLTSAGTLRFSHRAPARTINALVTNGTRIAAALDDVTQFRWISMQVLDTRGNVVHHWSEQGFGLGNQGGAYNVAMTSSGRVIAGVNVIPFGNSSQAAYEYVLGLAP